MSYEELKELLKMPKSKIVQKYSKLANILFELEKEINYEINNYDRDVDIETETLSGEFLRGIAWEADYLKMKLKDLESKGE